MSPSKARPPVLRICSHASDPPRVVFPVLWGELSSSLLQRGWLMTHETGGSLRSAEKRLPRGDVGHVERWDPPHEVEIAWKQGAPRVGPPPRLSIRCRAKGSGTAIMVEHSGGRRLRGRPTEEQELGWVATEVVTPLLLAIAPARLVEWADDRWGRQPAGPSSRAYYKEPIYHLPGFHAILQGLALRKDDMLLEVGCGGGALLKRALATGCRAAAVDHSTEMLKVASQKNARALAAGHLQLRYGDAAALPFPSERFTCAVMSGVLPWLPDPVRAFREVFRTLRRGGRFVAWTGTPKMYGTPAAGPRRKGGARLYEDRALVRFARRAGFSDVRTDHPDLRPIAKAVGVPRPSRFLFGSEYGVLLWARRG
jgi:SAM-dependent methyltransferase